MHNDHIEKKPKQLTDLERAEKRKRRAEIQWQIAQHRDKVSEIERMLEKTNPGERRKLADLRLEIASEAWAVAQLRHEFALLGDEMKTDSELYPR